MTPEVRETHRGAMKPQHPPTRPAQVCPLGILNVAHTRLVLDPPRTRSRVPKLTASLLGLSIAIRLGRFSILDDAACRAHTESSNPTQCLRPRRRLTIHGHRLGASVEATRPVAV
ncbi:hypothetical protein GCM10009872_31780 [Actinopolymorpha rutila]